MKEVGSYEAKTHLPRLLREVAAGESFVITNHGVPVARLMPPERRTKRTAEEIAREAAEIRAGARSLDGRSIRDLIEEGRRF